MSKRIDIIAGARPNFMKIAPIIRALERNCTNNCFFEYRLVHTGQHYDDKMSGSFFEQLDIPKPDINLEVGSGTQGQQTAEIILRYEKLLLDSPSALCLVVGDVTSTMACAITAQKLGVPVAHVEAGIRSWDWFMPEEINRMVTDSITNYFFTTSEYANENLKNTGVGSDRIFFVGNTMIDTLLANIHRLRKPSFWDDYSLTEKEYVVLTMHRPSNVDLGSSLMQKLKAIAVGTRGLPIIFPVHPRTAKVLEDMDNLPNPIHLVEPQSYLEFNYLVQNSKAVITDSGGITEETTVMGVPCITLRDSTERPETVTIGTNELIGTNPGNIKPALDRLFAGEWKKGSIPEKWDGKAGERIVSHLMELLN
ncbi:UDP-N-acetylglucosamine 2-epimerase (non-hydrolyzing) [Opitutales bacterium]|nr:UDP-N-acetylglucosamine 2-epimerase (non-hydrolyzing) [Opitutales bacterium]